MELVFEYVDRYKHHPRSVPGLTWHEFVGLVERTGCSHARERLLIAAGIADGQPVAEDYVGIRVLEQDKIQRLAFPWRK
jgi:hypothetical protein